MHILRNEGMLTPNAIYEIFCQSKGKFEVGPEAYIHLQDKEKIPFHGRDIVGVSGIKAKKFEYFQSTESWW